MTKRKSNLPTPPAQPEEILGIRWQDRQEPECYIGKKTWKISRRLGTASGMDDILGAMDELSKVLTDYTAGKLKDRDMMKQRGQAVKKILRVAVPTLQYDAEADDPDTGPVLLTDLAIELRDFGLAGLDRGLQRSQMRLRLASSVSRRRSQA